MADEVFCADVPGTVNRREVIVHPVRMGVLLVPYGNFHRVTAARRFTATRAWPRAMAVLHSDTNGRLDRGDGSDHLNGSDESGARRRLA
jgi:hypothetical protein